MLSAKVLRVPQTNVPRQARPLQVTAQGHDTLLVYVHVLDKLPPLTRVVGQARPSQSLDEPKERVAVPVVPEVWHRVHDKSSARNKHPTDLAEHLG